MSKTLQKDIKLAERICTDECNRIYLEHDIDVVFDHYDNEVKTVYLRQSDNSTNPAEYSVLELLEEQIKKRVNKKWNIGVLISDLEFFDEEEISNDF